MHNRFKFKSVFCAVSLIIVLLTANCANNESRIKLIKLVNNIDINCPIKYDFATCISARIIDDEMVVNYVYDESFINLDALTQNPDFTKRLGGSLFFNESESKEFVNILISSGCGYKAILKGSKTKKETIIHFNNEEIKEISNHPQSLSDILDWQVEITNSMLPQQLDEITELISLEQDNISVSYIYSINEEKASMKQLEAAKNDFATDLLKDMKDQLTSPQSTSKQFLMLVLKTGKSIRFVYKGNKTGKTVSIEFSNNELKELSENLIK